MLPGTARYCACLVSYWNPFFRMIGRKTENPAYKSVFASSLRMVRHTVDKCHAVHVIECVYPGLNISDRQHQILLFVVSTSTAVGTSFVISVPHDILVFLVQKPRTLIVLGYEEETTKGKDDGEDALNDVQPAICMSFDIGHLECLRKGSTYHLQPGYPATPFIWRIAKAISPPKALDTAMHTSRKSATQLDYSERAPRSNSL